MYVPTLMTIVALLSEIAEIATIDIKFLIAMIVVMTGMSVIAILTARVVT